VECRLRDSAAPSRPTVSASIGQRLREPPEAASGNLYCPAPEGGKPTRPTNPRPGRMCFMRMLSFRRSNITTRPDLDSQQGARGGGLRAAHNKSRPTRWKRADRLVGSHSEQVEPRSHSTIARAPPTRLRPLPPSSGSSGNSQGFNHVVNVRPIGLDSGPFRSCSARLAIPEKASSWYGLSDPS